MLILSPRRSSKEVSSSLTHLPHLLKGSMEVTGAVMALELAVRCFASLSAFLTNDAGASANCDTAFFNPNDNQVQRACQADNV